MKNVSKRALCLILVWTLVFTSLLAFSACNDKPATETGSKEVTLVIVDSAAKQTVVTDKTDALHVDEWLKELNSENKITLTFTTSEYGMNITSLNGIELKGNSFFSFYADDPDNTNSAWGNYSYGDKTLNSCSYGQSDMPVKNGCTYVLAYAEY